ncbi:MAG: glycosyltransferase [Candidatus Sericytochromatia bacterium]|nr:glycosyltransferase [Candidatus Sericytochromatia bacterium]
MKLDPARWLIGPLQQGSLDHGLQQAWPEANFFDWFNLAQRAAQLPDLQGILVLEPLQRACPPALWQLQAPRVAICSQHPQLFSPAARRVLSGFDGLIAFEDQHLPAHCPDLPFSPEILWDLQDSHFSPDTPTQLLELLYIVYESWSPQIAQYSATNLPLDYFIHVHPARAQFYLSRCAAILLDTPRLSSLHFQALAAGRPLLVDACQQDLARYFRPGEDYGVYSATELAQAWQDNKAQVCAPQPDPQQLRHHGLRPTLLRALNSLKLDTPRQALPDHFALEQLAFSQGSEAFATRKSLLDQASTGTPDTEQHLLACWFYLHTADSPALMSDSNMVWQAFALRLAELPASAEKSWLSLRAALQRRQYAEALAALQNDPFLQPDTLKPPQTPGFFPADTVLEELIELWGYPQALTPWLHYQQALCLTHLHADAEACQVLEASLQKHYASGPLNLWLQLSASQPALRRPEFMQAMRQAYPLQLELAEHHVRDLATTDLPQARVLCEHYLNRCSQLYNQLLQLERWLALRSELFQDEAPAPDEVQPLRVFWEGAACSYSSLAGINRRWMQALSADPDMALSWLPFDPPEQPMDAAARSWQQYPLQPPDVFVAHRWPPRRQAPVMGHWINIFPWEFGVIPERWAAQFNRELDQVWVPSRFVAHSFEISGVAPERLRVIPNGVDTGLLHPEGERYPLPSNKSLRLLFVGGMVFRKGMDLLLQAYAEAFSAADDVVLVIKSFGNSSHYAYQGLERQLQQLQSQPEAPEILLISDDLTPEALASLYRACDVYVHPYRGEGFGMPILEAMACGLPAVIPNAGPAPEFCTPEASWQVYTRLRFEPTRDVQGQGLACLNPYFSEVDVSALARTLQQVAADPEARQRKAAAALAAAQAYDWQALYPQVKQALQDVNQTPLRRQQPAPAAPPVPKGKPLRVLLSLPALPLQPSQSSAHCIWLNRDNQPDLRIANQAGADILYLSDSHPPPASQQTVWCSTPAQFNRLQAQGQNVSYQPLAVDFTHFTPQAAPQRLAESEGRFAFLSILDWTRDGAWQDLLNAYLATFAEHEAVNLVLKPYGADPETMLNELMAWLEAEGHDPEAIAGLSFVEEDLDYSQLPGLYRGCDAFVTAHGAGNGIWHLAAQACGLPVLACGHYPFLERPFAEIFAPGDREHLGWLLRQIYSRRQAEASGIVRAALQPHYDLPAWLARAEGLLAQRP